MPATGPDSGFLNESGNDESYRPTPVRILLVIYMASVLLHIALLWRASAFPFFASDAVQYALTADNLSLGKGYTLRGHFNDSLPPAYPVFVAIALSIPADPHVPMLVLSSIAISLAIFPIYKLSRLVGLRQQESVLLAAAAAVLPHTFYAGMYMAETLQYPLFLTAFYLAMAWLATPNQRRAVLLGVMMGAILLNKLQGIQFVFPFFVVAAASLRGRSRQIAAMLFLTAVPILLWHVYKMAHAAPGFGAYGRALESGLPHWTWSLAVSYAADFLLAPGLITVVPLFLWMRATVHTQRAQVLFVAALFATQLLLVSTLDGGLTGWLRERLFLYCFPITAVLAARGLGYMPASVRQWFVFGGVPIAIAGMLLIYPFQSPIPLETPWAFALGTGVSKLRFAVISLVAIIVFSFLLFRFRRIAAVILAAGVLVFHAAALFIAVRNMEASVAPAMAVLQPVKEWLAKEGVVPGSRLLVAGRHNYFEPKHAGCRIDGELLDWTWRLGLPESTVWAIETLGRYDVRMIPDVPEFAAVSKPGDYFLTIAQPLGLEFVSRHPPYSLYRVPSGVQWDRVTFAYGR